MRFRLNIRILFSLFTTIIKMIRNVGENDDDDADRVEFKILVLIK